jgi:hypothetical protein
VDLDLDGKAAVVTEPAHAIINDLVAAGYVAKQKDGHCNRYQTQAHLPLPETGRGNLASADVLTLLAGPQPASCPAARQLTMAPAARRPR